MKRLLFLVALLTFASTVSANLTWNLAGTKLLPRAIANPTSFTSGGQALEATAYKFNDGWMQASTNQNIFGLGAWADTRLFGDLLQAQLDNIGTIEILQLRFPLLTAPVGANLTLAITDDDYTIWGNNTGALPTGTTIVGDILAQGQGSGLSGAFMNVGFNTGLAPYQFLYFAGKSVNGVLQSGCSGLCGDGYRVQGASAQVVQASAQVVQASPQVVPVPAALPLFLSALAGVVLVARRRTT
jgi:hypothetical protein